MNDALNVKENLEIELSTIRRELSEMADEDSATGEYKLKSPNYGNDVDSNSDEVTDIDKTMAIMGALIERKEKIEKTLKKVEQGSYGLCENCAKNIEPNRLKAIPVAYFCYDCADKLG